MSNEKHSAAAIDVLRQWFGDRFGDRSEIQTLSGGFSGAVIWRVSRSAGDLCLRRWPRVHPTTEGLSAIHGLLQHIDDAGFGLSPTPQKTSTGDTFVLSKDHLWELTSWKPGDANFGHEPSDTKLSAAMTTLAGFHQAACGYGARSQQADHARSPDLQHRLAILRDLQRGALNRLRDATRTAPVPAMDDLIQKLLEGVGRSLDPVAQRLASIAEQPLPLQWCLRDVHREHLLFTEERVTGLIDFGAAEVDSVAGDIARLLGSLVGDDPAGWRAGIAAYEERRRLSEVEKRAIVAFDKGGTICSAANWVRWLCLERRSFPQTLALRTQLAKIADRLPGLAER